MKLQTPAQTAWPFGVEVETTSEGLLLKPRRQPRQGWAQLFRGTAAATTDELAEVRHARNKFDAEEWRW